MEPLIGFAHRGARSEERENTLSAFVRALEVGANGLETDAWLTADGVVVLDHDGVTGPLWRRRAVSSQMRDDLPDHIPSLDELYNTCGADFDLSIDVKDPAVLEPLLAVVRKADAAERLWLCYHDWRPMAAWRRVAPDVHLVESTNLSWMSEGLDARVSALAAAGVEAVNLHRSQWDAPTVNAVHAGGLLAFAWDAQSRRDLDELVVLGVDAVYSDHVDRMVAALTVS